MGNCGLRAAFGECGDQQMVRVVTHSGGVMELYPPITAERITNGFPGYGLYRAADRFFSTPLLHTEELRGGEAYHLRPLDDDPQLRLPCLAAPYRMSFDPHGFWKRQQDADSSLPTCGYSGGGGSSDVWRVKLVISPAQLAEILSQEATTEELIESVRTKNRGQVPQQRVGGWFRPVERRQ